VLARLLELNQKRYEEEVAAGLHAKASKAAPVAKGEPASGKPAKKKAAAQPELGKKAPRKKAARKQQPSASLAFGFAAQPVEEES